MTSESHTTPADIPPKPAIDDETRQDLMDSLKELHATFEATISQLLTAPEDPVELRHALFRAVHNIKGNAGMVRLGSVVGFAHELEEVIGALRQEKFDLTPAIAETLLIGLDRIQDLHEKELFGVEHEFLHLDKLTGLYQTLAQSPPDPDLIATDTLQSLGAGIGGPDKPHHHRQKDFSESPAHNQDSTLEDLIFFQELGFELDNQIPHWQGRSAQLYDWAMKMNQIAGSPVELDQLAAAIYMHDIGMSLVERELWETGMDSRPSPKSSLFRHPEWGYQFVSRIQGWQDAATIILQHHELINGSGYPSGLRGEDIHPGAKILAILECFFQLTRGPVDASMRQSTVRAVSAINARINSHYEGLWVQCFNHVIRNELRAGNL